MKQLIVLIGPNAVGKSTTARKYVELHPKTAYVDSDWCRVMNPFSFTDATKQTVSENIYCLIHNYLNCNDINTVIFTYSWHGVRKEIYDNVIEKLRNNGIEFDETLVYYGDYSSESGTRGCEYLMSLDNPPDAIFSISSLVIP